MTKILLTVAFLCASIALRAQVSSIGPTVGYNHAWISDADRSDPRPSFNLGIIYNHSIFERFGLSAEARYSQEGSKTNLGGVSVVNKVSYVRVPISFVYYFGSLENDFRPKFFVGPSFGLLVGGETKTQVGETTVVVDAKDVYEPFDFGLQGGVGFNYRLSQSIWLNFNAAYTHGFIDIVSDNNNNDSQNRLVNLNLGVAFGF